MNVVLRLPHALKGPQIARILSQRLYCAASANPIKDRIQEMVKKDDLVVFMKGVPDQPMCGFSNAVIQILRMHGVDKFASYNVLEDEELRQGVKEFSSWPTIPQIYIGGDFVGGCDIMIQMHQEGELIEELKKIGITSALLEQAAEEQSGQDKKE